MSEYDMQPNILIPGQNWVTEKPANAHGQRVHKRGSPVVDTPSTFTSPTTIYISAERSLSTQQDR